jgi:hypothetical protein
MAWGQLSLGPLAHESLCAPGPFSAPDPFPSTLVPLMLLPCRPDPRSPSFYKLAPVSFLLSLPLTGCAFLLCPSRVFHTFLQYFLSVLLFLRPFIHNRPHFSLSSSALSLTVSFILNFAYFSLLSSLFVGCFLFDNIFSFFLGIFGKAIELTSLRVTLRDLRSIRSPLIVSGYIITSINNVIILNIKRID